MIYPLVYGNIISIIKTRRSVLSNDHRRVSALQEPLPSEGPPNDRWYAVFDEEHKNSQWALLDPKGKIKPLASDERQPAPVNFGDQITLGASVPVNGVATMCYLSCRDDARAGAGRKVATALHPNPWELWTIIDPTNTTSTRQVHTDDVIVLQSAFGDYLSATTTSANKVLQTAPSSSEAERWIAGSPVLLERKLLHYQDGICIVKGDDDDDDRKHISAPGTKTGTVGLDTTALSDANRWIIWKDDDRGTEKAARFGDIVLLRTDKLTNSQEAARFLFMTYRRGGSVEIGINQYKKTETERWKIVDPYAPDSVGQVRYGDRFALKGLSGTGEYLVAKAGGAGTSPTRDGAAIWTLGDPVTEASADLGGAKIPQAANDSAIMLYASHNIAKTAISKGLGMIPTVGPMVAGLYGIMYPMVMISGPSSRRG